MSLTKHDTQSLAAAMREARSATSALALQLKRIGSAATNPPWRSVSACPGGQCSATAALGATRQPASPANVGQGSSLSSALSSSLTSALKSAFSGDFTRSLQSLLSGLIRSLSGSLSKGLGGGIGGSLLGGLLGTGLSLLAGRLFRRREKVQVDNVVRAEVLNFPRLSSLDFASNPASRLFGGRAVARGPAFSVEISYRDGAQDIISAKVAQQLSTLNGLGL